MHKCASQILPPWVDLFVNRWRHFGKWTSLGPLKGIYTVCCIHPVTQIYTRKGARNRTYSTF